MAYKYPYGNTEQMNLDWFLTKFRELQASWDQLQLEGVVEAAQEARQAANEAIAAAAEAVETAAEIIQASSQIATNTQNIANLSDTVENLDSADIADNSDAGGPTVEDSLTALKGSLNVFEKAKSVSSTSDFGTSSFNFSVTAAFSIGNTGVTLPRYCKGSFICSGSNDAVLYGVDLVNGVFYFAARNSGTWAFAHSYDESYHPFTVTGTIGNGTMYIDDTRITANTRLLEVEFGTPENVPYKYSWTTSAGRLTFASVAGTFSETTVTAILGRTN